MPRSQHGTQPRTIVSTLRPTAAQRSRVLRLRFAGTRVPSTALGPGRVSCSPMHAELEEVHQLTPGRSLLSVFTQLVWWPLTPHSLQCPGSLRTRGLMGAMPRIILQKRQQWWTTPRKYTRRPLRQRSALSRCWFFLTTWVQGSCLPPRGNFQTCFDASCTAKCRVGVQGCKPLPGLLHCELAQPQHSTALTYRLALRRQRSARVS